MLVPCQQRGCRLHFGGLLGDFRGCSPAQPGWRCLIPCWEHTPPSLLPVGGATLSNLQLKWGPPVSPPAPAAARFAQQPFGINNSPCLASSIINVHQPGGEGRQEQPQPGPCALGASPSSVPPAPAAATPLVPSPPALSRSPPKLKNISSTPGRASIKNWACLGAREDGAELPQPLPTLLWGWKYGEGAPPAPVTASPSGSCAQPQFAE